MESEMYVKLIGWLDAAGDVDDVGLLGRKQAGVKKS